MCIFTVLFDFYSFLCSVLLYQEWFWLELYKIFRILLVIQDKLQGLLAILPHSPVEQESSAIKAFLFYRKDTFTL